MSIYTCIFYLQKVTSHAKKLWECMKDLDDKEVRMTHDGELIYLCDIYRICSYGLQVCILCHSGTQSVRTTKGHANVPVIRVFVVHVSGLLEQKSWTRVY